MKKKLKYTIVGLAGGALLIGGIAAYQATGAGYTLQTAIHNAGLPDSCQYVDESTETIACEGIELASILSNSKIQETTALDLTNVTLGSETSLHGLNNLKGVYLDDPVDPESISTVIGTSPSIEFLTISNPIPKDLSLSIKAASLGFSAESEGASIQTIDPGFNPGRLMSDVLYDLNPKTASKLELLMVQNVIKGDHVDLSGYSSLESLSIKVNPGAKVSLPKHLSGHESMKIVTSEQGTEYSYPE